MKVTYDISCQGVWQPIIFCWLNLEKSLWLYALKLTSMGLQQWLARLFSYWLVCQANSLS